MEDIEKHEKYSEVKIIIAASEKKIIAGNQSYNSRNDRAEAFGKKGELR